MARSWKMWLLAGMFNVPATLWGQLPLEPPAVPSTPTPSVSQPQFHNPPASQQPSDLPPLPPGFDLPGVNSKPAAPVPTKPNTLPISIEKPDGSKPPATSSSEKSNHVLPPPASVPNKPSAPPQQTPPVVPDISGMPGGEDAFHPASWPPSVPAPVAPMPMPSPPPTHHTDGPSGWVFFGDVLFWRPRLNEPQFVITQTPAPNTFLVRFAPWPGDYEVAFRTGLGYLFQGGVYIWGEYTHYDNLVTATSFTVPNAPQQFVAYNGPGISHGQLAPAGDVVTSSWDLRYHTLDIMAGAVLSPTEFFDVILAAGARLADFSHRFSASFTSGGGANFVRDHFQIDTEGAGPRLGTEGRLYLWRGPAGWSLAFYSRGYASLLFADIDETDSTQTFVGRVLNIDSHLHYSRRQILPQVELAVGGEWSLFGGRLIVAGGYEWIYWFDAATSNTSAIPSDNVQHQDLSFDGPFIRAILLW